MLRNDGYCYVHQVQRPPGGERLVDHLAGEFPHSNADLWIERIRAGELSIDNKPAQPESVVLSGNVIRWNRPGWQEEETPQHFEVLYEDRDILAINKPSGLPTLPGAGFYQNTLLMKVRARFPSAQPLHRLGRATSGIVLFGLHPQSVRALTIQWPETKKIYRALAQGIAKADRYEIDQPIGPLSHPRLGTVHAASASGKRARSIAVALERRESETLFEVEIETGRPHQIRIHLASIDHPLVGDPLYRRGGVPIDTHPGLPGDGGYLLHATHLHLSHPTTGESLELVAPPPASLAIPSQSQSR